MLVRDAILARSIDALRELRPDLADFLELAIAERVEVASNEAKAHCEQLIEEYIETIAEQKRQLEAYDRIGRQVDALSTERVTISIEPMSERLAAAVEAPPVNNDHLVEDQVEQLIEENNRVVPPIGPLDHASPETGGNILAMTPPEEEDELEAEWQTRLPHVAVVEPVEEVEIQRLEGEGGITPVQEPAPFRLSHVLPETRPVDPKEIEQILGYVTPLTKGSSTPVETVIRVLLNAVAGQKPSEASKEAGVLPQHGSRWILIHERHIKNLKKLVRPEAQREYLTQLQRGLVANL